MPLIDLQTDLKSLKFGKDRPGGGSSNQPYIKKDIPGGDASNLASTGGPDVLLRGGLLAPVSAANDVSRLAQMFFDLKTPGGPLFIIKENTLSRTSVKTEASKGAGYGGGAINQGIYTPLSTLGQAASGFTGTHLNLLGLDPTSPMTGVTNGGLSPGAGLNRYEDVFKNQSKENNRLVDLFDTKINKESNGPLLSYSGGPGSVLGIGNTNIQFADRSRTGKNNPEATGDTALAFWSGSRPNARTTEDFIDPITKGASEKFTEYGGEGLTNEISSDGGYGWENTQAQRGTESGSLQTNPLLPEAIRPNNKTTEDFIDPTSKGASEKFTEYGGEGLTNTVSSEGGYTWENTQAQKGTESGSLQTNPLLPKAIVKSQQTLDGNLEGGIRINYQNTVSDPTNEVLNSGITLLNNGIPFYAKTTNGSFFNKVENTQLTRVASLPVSVVTPESDLEGGVRVNYDNAINNSASSSITKQILDSGVQLTNEGIPYYDKTTVGSFYDKEEDTLLPSKIVTQKSVVSPENNSEGGVRINFDNATSKGATYRSDLAAYVNEGRYELRDVTGQKAVDGLFINQTLDANLPQNNPTEFSAQTSTLQKVPQVRINYSNAISSKGLSTIYNTLIEPVGGQSLEIDDFSNGAYFFNVYDPTTVPGNTWPTNTVLQGANGAITYNQTQIIETTPISKGGVEGDFRATLTANLNSSTVTSKGYSANIYNSIKKENRVNLGDPGKSNTANGIKDVFKYSTSTTVLDKITASPIYTGSIAEHEGELNDFVKFSIGFVNNDATGDSTFMNFRAFLDSFDDKYTAEWGDVQYVGRADKFYNYKGFNRSISLSWTVYAQSKAELIPMYKKLNYLASCMAPSYSSGGFMQGNIARLTVGGYVYNQLGIIKGITYTVPQESPWEIGITEEGGSDESVKELPHMIKVSGFEFIPIQDFVPARGQRFISLSNGYNNNYDS
jgi:hypothetical protein